MSEIKVNNPQKCESCGNSLECGAKTESCWCFSLAISPSDLAQLNQQYKNCLCRACLEKLSQPEKEKHAR